MKDALLSSCLFLTGQVWRLAGDAPELQVSGKITMSLSSCRHSAAFCVWARRPQRGGGGAYAILGGEIGHLLQEVFGLSLLGMWPSVPKYIGCDAMHAHNLGLHT